MGLVTVGGFSTTVMTSVLVSVLVALIALIITLTGPPINTVGEPVIKPVTISIINPVGNPVALNEAGRLLAVIW